jgi:hypothetical protein
MNTYRVEVGQSVGVVGDVLIVRAKNCAEAEKKAQAEANANKIFTKLRVIKIEELRGTFIE